MKDEPANGSVCVLVAMMCISWYIHVIIFVEQRTYIVSLLLNDTSKIEIKKTCNFAKSHTECHKNDYLIIEFPFRIKN